MPNPIFTYGLFLFFAISALAGAVAILKGGAIENLLGSITFLGFGFLAILLGLVIYNEPDNHLEEVKGFLIGFGILAFAGVCVLCVIVNAMDPDD